MAISDTRKFVEHRKALVRVGVFLHKLYEVQFSYVTQQWNKVNPQSSHNLGGDVRAFAEKASLSHRAPKTRGKLAAAGDGLAA